MHVLLQNLGPGMWLSLPAFMRIQVLLRKVELIFFSFIIQVTVFCLLTIIQHSLQGGKQIQLNLIQYLIRVVTPLLTVAPILFQYSVVPCHIAHGNPILMNTKILLLVCFNSGLILFVFLFYLYFSLSSFLCKTKV